MESRDIPPSAPPSPMGLCSPQDAQRSRRVNGLPSGQACIPARALWGLCLILWFPLKIEDVG